jgi:predicted Zn-dependent protease
MDTMQSIRSRSGRIRRLAALGLSLAAAILLLGAAFAYDLARDGLLGVRRADPYASFEPLPVSSRQLTVQVLPLVPSARVRAAVLDGGPESAAAGFALLDAAGLNALCADLQQLYPFSYELAAARELPDECFDFERRQYRIDLALDWLVKRCDPAAYRTLGVLPVDVYAPEFNFLFGQARIFGPACICSSARMSAAATGGKTPQRRLFDIARHELGHALGLQHVGTRSLMRYSDSLAGLDSTVSELSSADWQLLRRLHQCRWER